jgi:hypothetical protein
MLVEESLDNIIPPNYGGPMCWYKSDAVYNMHYLEYVRLQHQCINTT